MAQGGQKGKIDDRLSRELQIAQRLDRVNSRHLKHSLKIKSPLSASDRPQTFPGAD